MSDALLPSWATKARVAASFAFATFGLVLTIRYVVLAADVMFGDGTWADDAPMWLAVPAAIALTLALLFGAVRVAGEVVAGVRTPKT